MSDDIVEIAIPGMFCRCRVERDSPACRRKRMQGRTLRRQALPRGPAIHHRSRCRLAPTAGARGAGVHGGDADDGGGGSPPHYHDRAYALRLVERIGSVITESATDGGNVMVIAALIAAMAHVLAREPELVHPSQLHRTLNTIQRHLRRHIASALRIANADKRGERP